MHHTINPALPLSLFAWRVLSAYRLDAAQAKVVLKVLFLTSDAHIFFIFGVLIYLKPQEDSPANSASIWLATFIFSEA